MKENSPNCNDNAYQSGPVVKDCVNDWKVSLTISKKIFQVFLGTKQRSMILSYKLEMSETKVPKSPLTTLAIANDQMGKWYSIVVMEYIVFIWFLALNLAHFGALIANFKGIFGMRGRLHFLIVCHNYDCVVLGQLGGDFECVALVWFRAFGSQLGAYLRLGSIA